MNSLNPQRNTGPLREPLDILLADIAIRVQLSATDYNKAVSRYEAIGRWIEREDSVLADRLSYFYPQGSMATGTTIAKRMKTDEFDIDLVAELDFPANIRPKAALDLLYDSINGDPGSRYYRMAERRNRCVTVHYADNMHLDVTPAILVPQNPARTSTIFNHKPESSSEPEYSLLANPWGFSAWFKEKTGEDAVFAEAYGARVAQFEASHLALLAEAESEPVPVQQPPHHKTKAVIVLQLLKRWRNVKFDSRKVRRPPSIYLAKLIADVANRTPTLYEELLFQSEHLLQTLDESSKAGVLVFEQNPRCPEDVLTDRWPSSMDDQLLLLEDAVDLTRKLRTLANGCPLDEMQRVLSGLFGELPTGEVFKSFVEHEIGKPIRDGQSSHIPGSGGLVLPSLAPEEATSRTRRHRFFGS